VITSLPPTDAALGEPYFYEVEATGNPAPTYALTTYPPGMTIEEGSGLIEWTPIEDQVGANNVVVVASNNIPPDAVQSFAVDVSEPVPEAPSIVSTPDQTAAVGQQYVYGVEATGSPEPAFALAEAPEGMTIGETSGRIEWTPTADQLGSNSVKVVASNGVNPDASQSFVIQVGQVPPEPPSPPPGPAYYVAPNGNNSNAGSENSPFRTIQHGVNQLRPGDTLIVRAGTYHEALRIQKSGTADRPITIMAYPGERPIVDGQYRLPSGPVHGRDPKSGNTFTFVPLVSLEGKYIVFDGLEVKRSAGRGMRIWPNGYCTIKNCWVHETRSAGISVYRCPHNRIEGNRIWLTGNFATYPRSAKDVNWPGGLSMRGADHVVVHGNELFHVWGEAILPMQCHNLVISDNLVYNNYAVEIYVDWCSNVVVSGNFVYHTGEGPFLRNGKACSGIVFTTEDPGFGEPVGNQTVINNICVGNVQNIAWWGSRPDGGFRNAIIANNTLVNAVGAGLQIPSNSAHSNVQIRNNIIYEAGGSLITVPSNFTCSHNAFSAAPPSSARGQGDVIGNPGLVDVNRRLVEGASDPGWYKLVAGSACRDAGFALSQVKEDFWKTLRDNSPSIGAHEYRE
jgi:hypothetical protein